MQLVTGLGTTAFSAFVLNCGAIIVLAANSTTSAANMYLLQTFPLQFLVPITLTSLCGSYKQDGTQRDIYITSLKLKERRKRAEQSRDRVFQLLEKAPLPAPIIESLRRGKVPKRDEIGTFLFADIVGFTAFSSRVSAKNLVKILNSLFVACDNLAEASHVTKIKTLGDCYVAATGILGDSGNEGDGGGDNGHAAKMCRFALRLHDCMSELNDEHGLIPKLRWRIGVHSGSCIGGVIGSKKCVVRLPTEVPIAQQTCGRRPHTHSRLFCFLSTSLYLSLRFIYDLWGSAVTMANLMEEHGEPGRVRLSSLCTDVSASKSYLTTFLVRARTRLTHFTPAYPLLSAGSCFGCDIPALPERLQMGEGADDAYQRRGWTAAHAYYDSCEDEKGIG